MKKLSILLIIILGLITLEGCKIKNESKNYPNGFDITVSEELLEYFIYKEDVPKLHFDYDNVNVTTTSVNSHYILVNNDFYKASDAWANHLSMYDKSEMIIIQELLQTDDDGKAKFGKEHLKLDAVDEFGNEQTHSKEIRMVAWNKETNGTRYSYQHRTFVSGGKRYYIYCYSTSLSVALEQSLMVVRVNNQNKLLLVPLPFDTKYEVSGSNLTIDALINKDTYLGTRYRRFAYPSSLSSYSLEEKIAKVKEWYTTYCGGHTLSDMFLINYAGARYEVKFNVTKKDASTGEEMDAFELLYLGDAQVIE